MRIDRHQWLELQRPRFKTQTDQKDLGLYSSLRGASSPRTARTASTATSSRPRAAARAWAHDGPVSGRTRGYILLSKALVDYTAASLLLLCPCSPAAPARPRSRLVALDAEAGIRPSVSTSARETPASATPSPRRARTPQSSPRRSRSATAPRTPAAAPRAPTRLRADVRMRPAANPRVPGARRRALTRFARSNQPLSLGLPANFRGVETGGTLSKRPRNGYS